MPYSSPSFKRTARSLCVRPAWRRGPPPRPGDDDDRRWFGEHPDCNQRLRAPIPGEVVRLTGWPAEGPAAVYVDSEWLDRHVITDLIVNEQLLDTPWLIDAVIAWRFRMFDEPVMFNGRRLRDFACRWCGAKRHG
jgi:hypothetical protein